MKHKNNKKEISFIKKNIYLIIVCFLLLSLSTIGYSALNQKLYISGDLVLRGIKDIRITSLELLESVNGGYEYYNSKYSNNYVSISGNLPNKGSAITYEATIINAGNVDMTISSMKITTSNSIVTLKVDDISVEDIIPYNNSKIFRITLEKTTVSDITEFSGLLELTFKEAIPDSNFCLDNGFNKLSDCILVMDTKNVDLEETKNEIKSRVANFKQIAPYITYKEKEQLNVVGTNITSTKYDKIYFSTEKPTFDKEAAIYTFSSDTSVLGSIKDYISNGTTKYYTCMNIFNTCAGRNVYVIYDYTNETDISNTTTYKVTKADRYTYEIDSVDSSSSGIYTIGDLNNTISYYYRGDIKNNYVEFGKDENGNDMYWRIVRINGDGSIRMIYTGTSTTATGYATGILNRNNTTTSAFNLENYDVAYVGYMYGLDQTYIETSETLYLTYAQIQLNSTYYFSDNVTCSDETKDCTLTGNIISGKWYEIYPRVLNGDENNGNIPYKYTCFKTSSTDLTCEIYSEVKDYVSTTQAKVRYHGYLSKDLDSIRANTYDSNIKQEIDAWYERVFINNDYNKDIHNVLYTTYLANSVFCNDRSVYSGNVNNLTSINFWAYRRLISLQKPSLKCGGLDGELSDVRDLFTVESSNGNGTLTYPIGLLTSDEAYLAGARIGFVNQSYYLATGSYYWLSTPFDFSLDSYFARGWNVYENGTIDAAFIHGRNGIRPVINLKSDVLINSGIGTQTEPYEITIKN